MSGYNYENQNYSKKSSSTGKKLYVKSLPIVWSFVSLISFEITVSSLPQFIDCFKSTFSSKGSDNIFCYQPFFIRISCEILTWSPEIILYFSWGGFINCSPKFFICSENTQLFKLSFFKLTGENVYGVYAVYSQGKFELH